MVIHENTTFQEGLSKLLEMKFGKWFGIVYRDPKCIDKNESDRNPKLIIIDEHCNKATKQYITEMKRNGSKIVMLSLDAKNISEFDLELFSGFLSKNMTTSEMLKVLKEIIDDNNIYVHPDVGIEFLRKLVKN